MLNPWIPVNKWEKYFIYTYATVVASATCISEIAGFACSWLKFSSKRISDISNSLVVKWFMSPCPEWSLNHTCYLLIGMIVLFQYMNAYNIYSMSNLPSGSYHKLPILSSLQFSCHYTNYQQLWRENNVETKYLKEHKYSHSTEICLTFVPEIWFFHHMSNSTNIPIKSTINFDDIINGQSYQWYHSSCAGIFIDVQLVSYLVRWFISVIISNEKSWSC